MPYSRRKFIQTSTGAIAGLSLLGCSREPSPAEPVASGVGTTVFLDGTVLPVDSEFSEHSAIAIRNGRILAVGSEEDVVALAGRGATKVQLDGRVVLLVPSGWLQAGATLERRFADRDRRDAFWNPAFYFRGAAMRWINGNIGVQVAATIRYQPHFNNIAFLIGPRFIVSIDRALADLRPSRAPYKRFTAWYQDRRAEWTYGDVR